MYQDSLIELENLASQLSSGESVKYKRLQDQLISVQQTIYDYYEFLYLVYTKGIDKSFKFNAVSPQNFIDVKNNLNRINNLCREVSNRIHCSELDESLEFDD